MESFGQQGHACDARSSSGSEEITPPLTVSSTITNGYIAEHEQGHRLFELEMRVALAERENHDLAVSMSERADAELALSAQTLELEATKEELAACKQALTLAQEDATRASRLRERVDRLRQLNENLGDDRDRLLLQLDEVKAQLRESQEREHSVNQVQPNVVAALEAENDTLTSKINELTAEHLASAEAAQRNTEAARFAEAKLRNVEYELQQLRQEMSRSEATRAGSQSQRLRVAAETNGIDDMRAQHSLQAENTALKAENAALQSNAVDIKDELAHYITKLDINNAGFRAFDCSHDNYRDTPTIPKHTNEFRPDRLAHGLFASLCEDEQFIACYNNHRQHYLKHHRFHERFNDEGRAVLSWRLKREFVRLDENRGVAITYR
ncbi:hypothetical protein NX059_002493 [Plenodomus lindquistii]|nr:hypothetical protein NX059_002493 [Plenodomus lindquistii]